MTTSYNPDYDTPAPPDDIDEHEHHHYDEEVDDGLLDANGLLNEEKQQRIRIIQDTASPLIDPLIDPLNTNTTTKDSLSFPYVSSNSQSLSSSPNHHHSHYNTHRRSNSNTMKTSLSASKLPNISESNIRHSIRKSKYNMSTVERIISITPTCYLKPKCFFVAWNSVITLVFNGWPEPIDTMKKELESSCTVCKEMFGSKFPKITLGCVKDGIEITPRVLAKIRRLCESNPVPKDYILCVDSLSVVLWENRCQESIIYEKIIPTKKNHKFLGSPRPLLLNMEDQDDSPYLRSANRTSHYKSLIIGASIVHRLVHVPKFITDFQKKLPREIYDVFTKDSLHVTIRSLC